MRARVKVVVKDYNAWLTGQPASKYDGVISSEFLPEITSKQMQQFFGQCGRVVKSGGSAGFKRLHRTRFESGLLIRSKAAKQFLKEWGIKRSYWKLHVGTLERDGLEIPDWIIVGGTKPS